MYVQYIAKFVCIFECIFIGSMLLSFCSTGIAIDVAKQGRPYGGLAASMTIIVDESA